MKGRGQQALGEESLDGASLLSATGLSCVRGGRLLFSGINFALSGGEAVLVTGPNGIGKSSLLRLCAGLLPAYAGHVAANARLALADEKLALDRDQTLARALGFWADLDRAGESAVPSALAALDMAHLAEVPVRMLSTGQRKRAVLARVIASGAPLWLLDEPGNGLDSASLDRLAAIMADHRARGGAILAVSHQPLLLPDATTLALRAA